MAVGRLWRPLSGRRWLKGPCFAAAWCSTSCCGGAKGEAEKEKLVSVFDGLPQLDVSGETWIEAGLLASKLRGKGQTLPMSDVLIATLALKHGAVVLTIDRHFFAVEGLIVRSEA